MLDEGGDAVGLTAEQRKEILSAALDYATRGWLVFPMNVSGRFSYTKAAESDGRRWGMSKDPDEIRQYFATYPNASLGIATGAQSGIIVVETDTLNGGHSADGLTSLAKLEELHGALPATLEAESPSGSIHRYYKHPGIDIKNSAGLIGPGIDVRGDRGMVIAPPSIKPGKGAYRWRNDLPVADAPQWLIDKCLAPSNGKAKKTTLGERNYGMKVLQDKCDKLAGTVGGSRNNDLNIAALLLAKLVAAGALQPKEVRSGLFNASVANKLVRDDGKASVWATIESGYNEGITERWSFDHDADEDGPEHDPHQAEDANGSAEPAVDPWPYTMAKDFRTDYNRNWIIKNVLAPGEVSNWCAPPKTGKSALVGDLSLHVTAGRDWRGYKSKQQGAVIYFALERADLVRRRFNAQAAQYGLDPKTLHFAVIGVTIDMMRQYCVGKFVSTIRAIEEECGVPVLMIVVDTSAKAIAAGGGEENSAKDKNIMRANARRVIETVKDLHVALVSHTGKDIEKLERGSNAGLGDDDMLVMLTRHAANIAARNDGPEGVLTNYGIMSVVVGTDDDGETIDISIIDPDTTAKAAPPKTKPKGQAGMALDFLVEAINEVGTAPPTWLELPKSVVKVVRIEQWEEQCRKRRLAGGKGKNFDQAFYRAGDKLQELHLIAILSDYAWILYE